MPEYGPLSEPRDGDGDGVPGTPRARSSPPIRLRLEPPILTPARLRFLRGAVVAVMVPQILSVMQSVLGMVAAVVLARVAARAWVGGAAEPA